MSLLAQEDKRTLCSCAEGALSARGQINNLNSKRTTLAYIKRSYSLFIQKYSNPHREGYQPVWSAKKKHIATVPARGICWSHPIRWFFGQYPFRRHYEFIKITHGQPDGATDKVKHKEVFEFGEGKEFGAVFEGAGDFFPAFLSVRSSNVIYRSNRV